MNTWINFDLPYILISKLWVADTDEHWLGALEYTEDDCPPYAVSSDSEGVPPSPEFLVPDVVSVGLVAPTLLMSAPLSVAPVGLCFSPSCFSLIFCRLEDGGGS